MKTAIAGSNKLTVQGLPPVKSSRERKVYLTDTISDRTFSGSLNFCVESSNGYLHISMENVSVYQYSSCIPLYNLSDISLSRPKDDIFIEEAA